MECKCGPLLFFSNFDSGNLARVERVSQSEGEVASSTGHLSGPSDGVQPKNYDFEYNVWTSPDCQGTPFENSNRTWFFFGVKGGVYGQTVKINIMNMNKQGRLYSQGMVPMVRTIPCRNMKWQRIRDRPSFMVVDGQFILSFTHSFADSKNFTTYFAFCYPYTFNDCQKKLDCLDRQFSHPNEENKTDLGEDSIYYHREILCYSLEKRRVDLITISSTKGILNRQEERLPGLFPDTNSPRCNTFEGKKVFFLTSRVHPGETPGSFVFDGFLDFILRRNDPRAAALRHLYVFKLIPLLNPDGVFRGFYRTDTRGVNLNRVYDDPDPTLHPSIFAVKTLIVYHHTHRKQKRLKCECDRKLLNKTSISHYTNQFGVEDVAKSCVAPDDETSKETKQTDQNTVTGRRNATLSDAESIHHSYSAMITTNCATVLDNDSKNGQPEGNSIPSVEQSVTNCLTLLPLERECSRNTILSEVAPCEGTIALSQIIGYEQDNIAKSELQLSDVDHSSLELVHSVEYSEENDFLNSGLQQQETICQDTLSFICSCGGPSHAKDSSPSGLGCYIDLHGHASKRGCFVYGNNFKKMEDQMASLYLPKLMSINCANFDFNACNFSERNMYHKDKRDGMSKEGSGRVAIYKATGLIYSYTLECNYNTGKSTNSVPPASYDCGKATPPPSPGFPPRFSPQVYEEVGRAIAISALDMVEQNPWSRLLMSEYHGMQGLRNWMKKYVQSFHNAPTLPKKYTREVSKTSSLVATAMMVPPVCNGFGSDVPDTNSKTVVKKGNAAFTSKKSVSRPIVKQKRSPTSSHDCPMASMKTSSICRVVSDKKQTLLSRVKNLDSTPPLNISRSNSKSIKSVLHMAPNQSFLDGIQIEKPVVLDSLLKEKPIRKARDSVIYNSETAKPKEEKAKCLLPPQMKSISWEIPAERSKTIALLKKPSSVNTLGSNPVANKCTRRLNKSHKVEKKAFLSVCPFQKTPEHKDLGGTELMQER